jgi:hypothetical protein
MNTGVNILFNLGFREAQQLIAASLQICILVAVALFNSRQAVPVIAIKFNNQALGGETEVTREYQAVVIANGKLVNVRYAARLKSCYHSALNTSGCLLPTNSTAGTVFAHEGFIRRFLMPFNYARPATFTRTILVSVKYRLEWFATGRAVSALRRLLTGADTFVLTRHRTVNLGRAFAGRELFAANRASSYIAPAQFGAGLRGIFAGAAAIFRANVIGRKANTALKAGVGSGMTRHLFVPSTKNIRQLGWGAGVEARWSAVHDAAIALFNYSTAEAQYGV